MSKYKVLITDFDGTLTEKDFFRIVLDNLPASYASYWESYEKGELNHFDALAAIFSGLRCGEDRVQGILAEMQLCGDIPGSFDRLNKHGWKVEVASAGCEWYIRRLLSLHGISPTIHANPGEFVANQGLMMHRPVDSPYFNRETGIDKAVLVRELLEQGTVAYAGDGRPDLAPILLVSPVNRFAKGWLAGELERRGELFNRFECWGEIAEKLLKEDL